MILTIDNLDGAGTRDCTGSLCSDKPALIKRKLNQPSELHAELISASAQFVVPVSDARVVLARADGVKLFTGYLAEAPQYEYLGWNEHGPVYKYSIHGRSDEMLLDRAVLPPRTPFIARSAGNALKQLATDQLPGAFSTGAVQDLVTLPSFDIHPEHPFTWHAAHLALAARAAYRAHDGVLALAPVGAVQYAINESDPSFSPDALKLASPNKLLNDVTIIGAMEPQTHVKDYFLGDGLTTRFALSHKLFTRTQQTIVDEEYLGSALVPTRWGIADPASAISVAAGKLAVAGGTGVDGATLVTFAEQVELGGGLQLQHGEVTFIAANNGVIGGLYTGAVSIADCLAGFRITPSGAQSVIQPLINGALAGSTLTTVAGHRYRLTTRLYATEIFRQPQPYFSSSHPAGAGRGGASTPASVRIVLEVHDIDPSNPASMQALSTVLYDGIISTAPSYCTYALVNSAALQCSISFTRLLRIAEAEVRSAIPGQGYRTRLVGSVADGAECDITSSPNLDFFSQYVPVANEAIVARYRDRGRASARISDPASIGAHAVGGDTGVRSAIRDLHSPQPRMQAECELAAQALLDDSTQPAWSGSYEVWSDFLPGGAATDIWPGDSLAINVPSRNANCNCTVREVDISVQEPASDRSQYKLAFANDSAAPLAMQFQLPHAPEEIVLTASTAASGSEFIADLTLAEVTAVTSTTVSIDAGLAPPAGGGIEARTSNAEWGPAGDRNLLGRFTTQTFSVTRLTRLVTYYLRQYDASSPPKYSRYSTALHVDYPA